MRVDAPVEARPEERGKVRLIRFLTTHAKASGGFWSEVGRGVVLAANEAEVTLRLDYAPEQRPGEAEVLPQGLAVELMWGD